MTPAQLLKHTSYFGRLDGVEEGRSGYDQGTTRCTALVMFRYDGGQTLVQLELYEDGTYTVTYDSLSPATLAAAARAYEFITGVGLKERP